MATREAEASVRDREGVAVIVLRGEINALAEEALESAYAEAIASDPRSVLLNFKDTDYINSTGIALIVSLLARARTEHRQITACGLSDHYREIFEITRLSDFMPIYPDEQSATEGHR
ncbi:MAG: anti-sigma factor antagonist [Pseudonocardiales bacterium]|nr:MAG: anti-sigma factor antagonist [Pseudonocardiales bacterium]